MSSATGMLIALSGLPGTGKSSLAKGLAQRLGAFHLRIDSIEQALLCADATRQEIGVEGYVVAYAIAEDNLRLGRLVIADSVNPLAVTRDAWRALAARAGVPMVDIEVLCSDRHEHRRRVESRRITSGVADIAGHTLPTWQDVLNHHYEPWQCERIVTDTAHLDEQAHIEQLDRELRPVMSALQA